MSTPAVEIRSFPVSIPAGTLQSAPLVTPVFFPARVVTEIHWRVPPGPAGTMGWKLTMSGGQNVLPTNGNYIVTDDHSDIWPVVNQPDGGYWEVTGYNTDIYPHTVYIDFFLQIVGTAEQVATFYANDSLSSPPAVTTPPPLTIPAITTPPPVTIPVITTPAAAVTPGLASSPLIYPTRQGVVSG